MNVPPAIIGVGRNYALHASEMGADLSDDLVVFMKNPASVIPNGAPIIIPACCNGEDQVDYEGELAVQLSRDCRNVTESEALAYVSGYAVANDITARLWQKSGSGGQWTRGKSFDTFCPITTFIPANKVIEPNDVSIQTILNGKVMQQGNTSQMIFHIPRLIAELSRDMTLLAGTIILTGTPHGVGVARTPQRFLQQGDVIEVIIQGIGHLKNQVQRADD